MILPVALISTCFLISACLGSKETCHPLEDECETIIVQRYFENCHKKDDLLLKCRTDFSELQKRHSDLQSKDAQNSKFQQGFLDLMKDHLEVLSKLRDSEVKYEQMINQKNGEIDLLRNQINDQKKTSDLSTLTHQFREDIAKLEKIVNIGGSDENNLTKAEVKTGKLQTTPLPNINNQTTSKTESIDFPDPCPRDQKEFHVLREIQLPGSDPFEVNCISHSIFGSGWLSVFNKRYRAPMNTHTYEDFERGYGDIVTSFLNEFFIGLNRWHHLTNGKPHEVLLNTYPRPIRCDNFVVGDQREGYKVKNIGNCSGSDVWMIPKQNSKFSTFDRDEDGDPGRNLAKEVGYGWWFDPSMSPKSPDSSYSFYIYIRRTD